MKTPAIREELEHRTVELFPLEGPIALAAGTLDSLEEDPTEDEVMAELDRIFGPDNSAGSEYIAGLILWIRNVEQMAHNEAALAVPFREEAERHERRAKALEQRAKWFRDRLAGLVVERGGKYSDGLHKVHTRVYHKVILVGTCSNENGGHLGEEHLESKSCKAFKVTEKLPANLGRMVIEPDKKAIQQDLLSHNGPRPWAELGSSVTAVIR